jgi:hypothetical protein
MCVKLILQAVPLKDTITRMYNLRKEKNGKREKASETNNKIFSKKPK